MSQILRELFFLGRTDIDTRMIYACPRPDMFPYYELLQHKALVHPSFKLTCAVDATAGLPWTEVRPRCSCCPAIWVYCRVVYFRVVHCRVPLFDPGCVVVASSVCTALMLVGDSLLLTRSTLDSSLRI
jgi:hypothetical protein